MEEMEARTSCHVRPAHIKVKSQQNDKWQYLQTRNKSNVVLQEEPIIFFLNGKN